ncbi:MAG: alpha/beta hydrolase [Parvibaculaceae bacterium]
MAYPMPSDPEVVEFITRTLAFYPADAFTYTVAQNRAVYDDYCAAFRRERPPGLQVTDFAIAARTPDRKIPARRYRPVNEGPHGEVAVLYLHGGGMVVGGLHSHDDVCAEIAVRTGLEVVAADYRLAPENPHPAFTDDAEAAFLHLAEAGKSVIVAGDSAGGNLTAAVCLRRKARGAPRPIGQILIYPGLGGDPGKGSYVENAEAPLLTTEEALSYFRVISGGRERAQVDDPDIMPIRAKDFSGLPPAFVVSADIDPLRDDARDYAEAIRKAGGIAAYRNEPQLVHGYLRARAMSRRAADSFSAICEAATRLANRTLDSGFTGRE